MLSTTKAILNACNKYKFLKNINHVKLQKEDLSNEDFNSAEFSLIKNEAPKKSFIIVSQSVVYPSKKIALVI